MNWMKGASEGDATRSARTVVIPSVARDLAVRAARCRKFVRSTARPGPSLTLRTTKYAAARYAPYAIVAGNPLSAYAIAMSAIDQRGVRLPRAIRRTIQKSAG